MDYKEYWKTHNPYDGGFKVCNKCGEELPKTEFLRSVRSIDGLRYTCKKCHNKYGKITRDKYRDYWKTHDAYQLNGSKNCTKCKKFLPVKSFGKNVTNPDGLQYMCKECKKKYDGLFYKIRDLRYGIVSEYKRERGCSICGFSNPDALDLHHINPKNKKYTISKLVGGQENIIEVFDELEKCIVLCRNCHMIYHADRRKGRIPIGNCQIQGELKDISLEL